MTLYQFHLVYNQGQSTGLQLHWFVYNKIHFNLFVFISDFDNEYKTN